jgi:hypothetical protein
LKASDSSSCIRARIEWRSNGSSSLSAVLHETDCFSEMPVNNGYGKPSVPETLLARADEVIE